MSDDPNRPPLDLSGTWRAGIADEELRRTWYGDDFDDRDFVDISVPAHWRTRTPFESLDDALLYRRRFSTIRSDEETRAWLCFDGICSQGDVWLDGSYLGNTDGAWIPHRFEVTDALARRNDHLLAVEVACPTPRGDGPNRTLLGTWGCGPYVKTGWNPGGIWREVRVIRTGPVAVIARCVVCTAANTSRATVQITTTLDAREACEVVLRTTVSDTDHMGFHHLATGTNEVTWSVDVTDPTLWWPYELGHQPLVDVDVDVLVGHEAATTLDPVDVRGLASAAGRVRSPMWRSDGFSVRCGLRQVSLRDWALHVNGERLFMRGVRVGPAHHAMGTAPATVFTDQIDAAKALGCNLVRVHGHLSRDELYQRADTIGMLVWQDLPLYRSQHRSVRRLATKTAHSAVERLGAHPSVVIWCAHDEPDGPEQTSEGRGRLRRFAKHELPNQNRSVLDIAVKRTLTAADPTRPVIGSSGTWPRPPALTGTDTHLDLGWSTGHEGDLARIARVIPKSVRFVQITPSPSLPADWTPSTDHQWPDIDLDGLTAGTEVDADLLARRIPPDAFTDATEWHRALANHQARLLRTQIETLRRLKYRPTGGFTVAHLGDFHDTLSVSLVDHNGRPKTAFDVVAACCNPVSISLDSWPGCAHAGEHIEAGIWVVSDLREPLDEALVTVDATWAGGDSSWSFSGTIASDDAVYVGTVRFEVLADVDRVTVSLRLRSGNVATENVYTVPVHVH